MVPASAHAQGAAGATDNGACHFYVQRAIELSRALDVGLLQTLPLLALRYVRAGNGAQPRVLNLFRSCDHRFGEWAVVAATMLRLPLCSEHRIAVAERRPYIGSARPRTSAPNSRFAPITSRMASYYKAVSSVLVRLPGMAAVKGRLRIIRLFAITLSYLTRN